MVHLAPFPAVPSAEGAAVAFVHAVVKHHGLPDDVVSDRGTQFTSLFWSVLCNGLGMKAKLSTAYYPQTDGQTERANQTLEVYLRCYATQEQDDCCNLLPYDEMAMNNSVYESTRVTPFMANIGYRPRFNVEQGGASAVPAAETMAQHLVNVRGKLALQLLLSKENYSKQADKRQSEGPVLQVGTQVLLNLRNVRSTAPSRMLGNLFTEPVQVKRVIKDSAVKLALPPSIWRVNPVFHVSLVRPWDPKTLQAFPERTRPPRRQPVEAARDDVIETTLDARWFGNKFKYRVKWVL
jgi:hypothetical protein